MSALEESKVRIHVGVEEKIGLPEYSSATIHASITRDIPEGTDEEIAAALRANAVIAEEFLAEERQVLLKSVQSK